MAHDVFVSYSTKDKVVADTIVSALEQNQIRCWYAPRDIQPSDDWGNAITEAIEACRVFLVIFSENANRSQRVLDEVNLAISQQDVILPFRIENLEPKGAMKLHLSSRHWLDAYEPSWETHIKQLVMTVSNNLEKRLAEADVKVAEAQPEKAAGKKTARNVMIGIAATAVVAVLAWQGYAYFSSDRPQGMMAEAEAAATEEPLPTETMIAATETQPVATRTLSPTATALPSAEEELGEPDYATDFSNSAEDVEVWPIGARDADGNVYYGTEGTLNIDDIEVFVYRGEKKYRDSIVEVDGKFPSRSEEPSGRKFLILTCRNVDIGNAGWMGIRATFNIYGSVSIELRNNYGSSDVLSSGTVLPFKEGEFNRFRFDCVGNDFSAYVNNTLVARARDTTFYSGTLGLASEDVEIVYDNFKLWLP